MARIKTLRMKGRRFGYKVGNSQIGVKEYFDVAEKLIPKLTAKDAEIVAWEQATSEYSAEDWSKALKFLQRQKASIEKRLRTVESRTWKPIDSFIIDRPSEDEINLETFVTGHVLRRIEDGMEKETEPREAARPATLGA